MAVEERVRRAPTGRPGASSARVATARAAVFAAACEGVRTPALAALDATDLTAREREIARLAAGGLSNRGIGSRSELAPLPLGTRHDA